MKQQSIDWSLPQRQPKGGLLIAFSKVLWEVIKKGWWLLLVLLLKDRPEEASRMSRYELIALFIVILTFTGTLLQYFYFRFYIINNELIIKKGWLKKQTQIIPLEKIQTVRIEASLLHQVLNLVKVSVDTAGSDKTEVKIDALSRPMAEALQQQLQTSKPAEEGSTLPGNAAALMRLSGTDLLKLSLSANHIETFFLILSFGVGLYTNLKDIDIGFLPDASSIGYSGMLLFFMVVIILCITIVISVVRICLKFYGLTVFQNSGGLSIRSGLTNVKEQVVTARKVQLLTWKANWIRQQLGLWLFEFRIAGNDELEKKQKIHVPVTRPAALPLLIETYYPEPSIAGIDYLYIHPSYVWRRSLIAGLFPAALLMAVTAWWWGPNALFFLIIPLLVSINALLYQRRFRLWALSEVVMIDKSTWGIEKVLLLWYKIQSVQLKQSLFQRNRGLATVIFYTAGGQFTVPFIPLAEARTLVNYALCKIESSNEKWM